MIATDHRPGVDARCPGAQRRAVLSAGDVLSPARPARALSRAEQAQVVATLHAPRFADLAPSQVYAILLDEGTYLCSERTMYRVLATQGEGRARRDPLVHPRYAAPELLATAPNQLWSWDISVPQQAA